MPFLIYIGKPLNGAFYKVLVAWGAGDARALAIETISMKLFEVENQFLEVVASELDTNFEQFRTEHGDLIIRIESPCKKIGHLIIKISCHEIMFSCEISHFHIERNDYKRQGKRNPTLCMLNEAINKFRDFIIEKTCVYKEIGFDGKTVSTGWCKVGTHNQNVNEGYLLLIEKLHGGPSSYEVWTWNKQ